MAISKEEILRRIKKLEKKLTELSQKYDSKVVKEFLDTWEKGLRKKDFSALKIGLQRTTKRECPLTI